MHSTANCRCEVFTCRPPRLISGLRGFFFYFADRWPLVLFSWESTESMCGVSQGLCIQRESCRDHTCCPLTSNLLCYYRNNKCTSLSPFQPGRRKQNLFFLCSADRSADIHFFCSSNRRKLYGSESSSSSPSSLWLVSYPDAENFYFARVLSCNVELHLLFK